MTEDFVEGCAPEPYSPDHISHSQLDLWDMCPKQWEYAYVQKLRRPSSGALILGSCYHMTLEENFKKKMILGHDLDFDICYDVFCTQWAKSIGTAWDISWGNDSPDELKDMGIALVGKYLDEVAPAIIPQYVELELSEKTISGVKFVLHVDLIDMNNVVIDHKTSSKAYTQADVDKDAQASATGFALGKSIVFHNHVAIKAKIPKIQIVKTYRTSADIDWWHAKALAILTHMKTGRAPPREDGWWCNEQYCGFYDICRKDLARSYR